MIVDVTAERGADRFRPPQREIVGLADVVEVIDFEHQVMNAVCAGIDEGERVVARIDVEEIGLERLQDIVGRLEIEDLGIERHHRVEPLGGEHGMAHAERAGAEAGNRASGLERLARRLGAVDGFQPVADRVREDNQIFHPAFVGERARAARDFDAGFFQMRGEAVERRRVGDFPAVERRPLALRRFAR